jgi:hypothetical protein
MTASYSPACNRARSAGSIADGSVTFLRSHLRWKRQPHPPLTVPLTMAGIVPLTQIAA